MPQLNCPFCLHSMEIDISDPIDKYVCENCGANFFEMMMGSIPSVAYRLATGKFKRIKRKKYANYNRDKDKI